MENVRKYSLINLDRLNSSAKVKMGNYLVFNGSSIKTVTGFESHKCAFWNYTIDGSQANKRATIWDILTDFIINPFIFLRNYFLG